MSDDEPDRRPGAESPTRSSRGAPADPPNSAPTKTSLESDPSVRTPSPGRTRFLPGTVLARRYRIVSLLGRGGMGEVYRADDLKLGQPVALKFLPESVQRDPARLERFLNEVKVALRVTHPNVCRVYDVGELPSTSSGQAQHYIAMEYVDGEDLASLLRRIGRLPKDKAVQIARQLCSGLAAAHDEGILHRDLKPANVMIDGRGRAKITDFGLATLGHRIEGAEAGAGTPLYMAPEQLAGREVTARSDLYSLGLVLYELFTGKRAFEARTPDELARRQEESQPTRPSSHVEGMDPSVERAILRCLEREPSSRPSSALAVAASLPGGDPLAAALAAGETPSPELVAAAGGEGSLRPGVAVSLLATVLVGLAALVVLEGRGRIYRQIPLPKPPAELTLVAREVVEAAGYAEPPADRVFGFERDRDYFDRQFADPSPKRWDDLGSVRPVPFWFWYRQSPRYMIPANYVGWLSSSDPPSIDSGVIDVRLDPEGRLLRFQAVPPERHEPQAPREEPDWGVFFERAGLEPADFEAADPVWVPLVASDARRAWTASTAPTDETPLRVEAGSFRGRPVYFEVIPEWRMPRRMEPPPVSTGQTVALAIGMTFMLGVMFGGLLLARRNLRLGRGDRRGATRLAAFVFMVWTLVWVLRIDHVPTSDEVWILQITLRGALFNAALCWIAYVALEPYVRRLWPGTLIAWTRLLDGRLRDPLIGRHVLLGALAGVGLSLLFWLRWALSRWLALPALVPATGPLWSLEGWPQVAADLLHVVAVALQSSMGVLLAIVLLRILLRRLWAVALLWILVIAVGGALNPAGSPVLGIAFNLVVAFVYLAVLVRLGLLSLMVTLAFFNLQWVVVTADPSAWYFDRSLVTVLLFAAIACYGFYTSLGGRPLIQDRVLEG